MTLDDNCATVEFKQIEDGSKMKSGRNQDTEYRIESSSMRSMFQVGVGREL